MKKQIRYLLFGLAILLLAILMGGDVYYYLRFNLGGIELIKGSMGSILDKKVGYLESAFDLYDIGDHTEWACKGELGKLKANLEVGVSEETEKLTNSLISCHSEAVSLYWIGYSYKEMGVTDETITFWKQSKAIYQLKSMGYEAVQNERWSEALAAYQAVVKLLPNDCISRVRLGNVYWHGYQATTLALENYSEVFQQCPDNIENYRAAIYLLVEQKRFSEAEQIIERFQMVAPNSDHVQTMWGLLRLRQNRANESVEYFTSAIKLNPNNSEAYALRGLGFISLGDYRNAILDLQRAIQIGPAQSWHYEALGQAYIAIEDVNNAYLAYQEALKMNPNRLDLSEELMRLEEQK